jgi:hypothetical protein
LLQIRHELASLAAPLYIGCYSVWDNADDDEANERWHREILKSLEPITRGHYMEETDLLASPTRAAESLAPGVWERLKTIRQRYDPPRGILRPHWPGVSLGVDCPRLPIAILAALSPAERQ